MKAGFFTIDTLYEIEKATDLLAAKAVALNAIAAQPTARPANINKVTHAVQKAVSKNKLLISCASFMLAHPSEGLKMDKGSK